MDLIRAGASQNLHLCAGVVAVFGGVRPGVNLEFLNRLDRGFEEGRVIDVPRGTYTVVEHLALILAHAVSADRDGGIAAPVLLCVGRDSFDDARHEPRKVREVAPIQW